MIGTQLSKDGLYRYTLERTFDPVEPSDLIAGTCAFIMLNPSTADAELDDPTIRRCIGYAKAWNFRRLLVGNLFAYRATDPKELLGAEDPVGPLNDRWLEVIRKEAQVVVCAWGAHKLAPRRARQVLGGVAGLSALKVTASGQPGHPLYLKKTLRPTPLEITR